MANFWSQLKRPFFILAPMADVTDQPFRQIILKTGKPDVFFVEFVSADGLASEKGHPKLIKYLGFNENERPIVAQFFGARPENFYKAAKLARELGFDGIDVNMGCPERKVVKMGAGIGLCRSPELAKEIIAATREGAGDLPVSIKTRLGLDRIDMDWFKMLLELKLPALSIHLRTMKEASKVPAHWDVMADIAKIRDEISPETLLIGNGDVMSLAEGREKAKTAGIEGVMLGRGVFHNPWVFNESVDPLSVSPRYRLGLLLEHVRLFTDYWDKARNFDTLKRFFKIYVSHWEDAITLRTKLMETKNASQVEALVSAYLDQLA